MKAFEYLLKGKVITVDEVSYAYIDHRVYFIVFDEDFAKVHLRECEIFINEFLRRIENFRPSRKEGHENVHNLPENAWNHKEVTAEYDFSKFPSILCPKCFSRVGPENCVPIGKFAYCPCCNTKIFKGVRFDGVREDGYPMVRAPRTYSEKPEKPVFVEPDAEALYESGTLRTKKMKLKISI